MRERRDIRLRRAMRRVRNGRPAPRLPAWLSAVLLGTALAAAMIGLLEYRLRPVIRSLAARQIEQSVTRSVTEAVLRMDADYDALVRFRYDADGTITAISADMGQANRIRGEIVNVVLDAVSRIDCYELGVPLGSLLDLDLLWGKGPVIRIRGLSAGTVNAQLNSEFRAAGVNQTLHRVLLILEVPVSVLLPGGSVRTEVSTTICLAETLIVGKVPQAYLTFNPLREGE